MLDALPQLPDWLLAVRNVALIAAAVWVVWRVWRR